MTVNSYYFIYSLRSICSLNAYSINCSYSCESTIVIDLFVKSSALCVSAIAVLGIGSSLWFFSFEYCSFGKSDRFDRWLCSCIVSLCLCVWNVRFEKRIHFTCVFTHSMSMANGVDAVSKTGKGFQKERAIRNLWVCVCALCAHGKNVQHRVFW